TIGEATGQPDASQYYLNGNLVGTINGAPAGSPGRLGLVGGGGYNEQSQSHVAEVIWYDRILNGAERQQVGAYLQSKYGIAGVYNASVLNSVNVGTFTGGDAGEGLDLTGNFLYAVN